MQLSDFEAIKKHICEDGLEMEILFLCRDASPAAQSALTWSFHKAKKDLKLKSVEDVTKHHVSLGTIKTNLKPHQLFSLMQGECWSPNNEALEFIEEVNAAHMSMSIGDCVKVNGKTFYCDSFGQGFRLLDTSF